MVLTGLGFDNGLLGSHIAALCSGVNRNDESLIIYYYIETTRYPNSSLNLILVF